MKKALRAQISILAGVFGFFAGGLINSGREIVDVMLGAVVGWGIIFFLAYMLLGFVYESDGDDIGAEPESPQGRVKTAGHDKKKGRKIDITVKSDENFEDIYKLK